MKKVAVLITCHFDPTPTELTKSEKISLKHLKDYLDNYDKFFMVPENCDNYKFKIKFIKSMGFKKPVHIMSFDRKFFGTPQSFNDLMMTRETYLRFNNYKYLFIYQLDALVFSDQLDYWCNKNYDYIAAPWIDTKLGYLTNKYKYPVCGGNGGLSLRNIQSCLKVFDKVQKLAIRSTNNIKIRMLWFWKAVFTFKSHKIWLNAPINEYPFNEDGFWSLEAPKYLNTYKVPPFKESMKFSFEKYPKILYKLNANKLPFGCHAWERYDKNFWLPFL